MAHLVIHPEDHPRITGFDGPWTIGDYPKPPPPDTRETKIATERMLWSNGQLCAAVGKPYFVEDEPNLLTHDQYMAIHAS